MTKMKSMRLKTWGTRGSIAISNKDSVQAGGNTTCFEVFSGCLPAGTHLCVDAGTGFVPMGFQYLSEIPKGLNYVMLFTHYHYDHTVGLTLAPPTFIDSVPMTLIGPYDFRIGSKEMVDHIFHRPYFPVDSARIRHKMKFKPLEDFEVTVIAIHPDGGVGIFSRDKFVLAEQGKRQLSFGRSSHAIDECLIITMQPTNHGEQRCISYRFEERPTGRVLVIATDHEDQVSVPTAFLQHLKGANLTILDGQYDYQKYINSTGGFGHGTPTGVVKLALRAGVERLGITHHDPQSTDSFLTQVILKEAVTALARFSADVEFKKTYNVGEISLDASNVFLCVDYAEYDV